MDDVFQLDARAAHHFQHGVITGDAQQAETNHQHAGNGATLEGHVQRLVQADGCRLRRAHVGANRNVHADVAGSARQYGTNHEADCRLCPEKYQDQHSKYRADDTDRRVLAVEVGLSAFLNCRGNFLHAVVARRLRQNPLAHDPPIGDCRHGTDQRKHQSC